jgi:glycosyltransferase involved in cell wall biosynthesis
MGFRLLVIPTSKRDYGRKWNALHPEADLEILQAPRGNFLLRTNAGGADLEEYLESARFHSAGYDFVVGEYASAFLWLSIFRLSGDETPFIILPHFNHFVLPDSYAALLASQNTLPHDVVFAGSSSACRSFAHFGFRCDPLFPPGIDLNLFRPLQVSKTSLRSSLGMAEQADILLYVGRVQSDKNVLELLDIFRLVSQHIDTQLVVCFNFSTAEYLSQCMQRAETIEGVRFVHSPDPRTLVQYYNAADLYVSAAVSIFETFGRAAVEAMACGTPPIVAEYDGFRDTVSHGCGILVPTVYHGYHKWPDIQRFSETILSALADRDSLLEMSRRGVQNARRFGRTASLGTMLIKMEASLSQRKATINPRLSSLSLQGYPPEIKALWTQLEGEPLRDLLADLLLTGKVPVQPSETEMQDFYRLWFTHY